MDHKISYSPIEISYRGHAALGEAQLYHRELEKFLSQQITPPSPIDEGNAALGLNEILLTIILASIGKALALSLLEYIEKRILEKNKGEEVVEFRFQIIIKKNLSDTGSRFPFQLKRIKNNALAALFNKIRGEISKL